MTEIERIIKKGVVQRDYISDEERCNYMVSKKMKKIWAIEMDLYLEFERVCKKHNLRYFVIGGTLLGAVRHKGFIPWDDDVDVCMPREDYEILCNKLYSEFKNPYFLQIPKTDSGYFISFARLRNSSTTSISLPYKDAMFNQGIAIDIFPLDYALPEDADFYYEQIYESIMKCSSYMKRGSEIYLNSRQLENYKKYQTDNPDLEIERINKLASRIKKSDYIALATCTVYPVKQSLWPSKCFDSTVIMEFENIEVAAPIGWDMILNITFGNYMEFPPMEKRGTWHSNVFWDPDKSYRQYQNTIDGGFIQCVMDFLFKK